MGQYQLTGSVKLGISAATTDVSTDILACTFKREYDSVERPATFGSLRKTMVSGAFADHLTVEFVSNGYGSGASAGYVDALVSYAVLTGTQVLYFDVIPDGNATVGVANPHITGTISVLEMEVGGTPGQLRKRSATFPVLTSTLAST